MKWITKNFENLKGLLLLPFGIYFLILATWNFLKLGITATGKDIGFLSLMIILTILATILIDRHYSQEIGRVKTTSNFMIIVMIIFILFVFFMVDYLDIWINSQLNRPVSFTSIAWGFLFAYPFFSRKQTTYIIFSLTLILLAFLPTIGLIPFKMVFNDNYGVWGYLLIGLGMIIGGLLDHYTLQKMLPPQPGSEE
ncbi:MAG: hypothetical protein IH585_14890 [Anaerolineaceae bacterium]|nr:hypothetical protein [Anaerolineaceae bacterium]